MAQANQDIRGSVKKAGLYLWQVADKYGLVDSNFSRLLRKELPADKKERIFKIIDELKKEAAGNE
ncbi:hypothetical protein SPSYN_02025 [Sporotomaculum syntrophicum]|uniref:Uncharacterized protein n=1 Tax=Sporotomaculum syntrophicum TaxID=182264 RepID=A0A9D2WNV1_9FIRM|nr:hypothetical protein [Sporotomaculum syntrophicum]KAF1084855.1 hypothetical protein SPSYN_02025 [Sporotomaculum syntrophicum]